MFSRYARLACGVFFFFNSGIQTILVLFLVFWVRDPRLTFRGRALARSLNEAAKKDLEREGRRVEVAERAVKRAKKKEELAFAKFDRENELKKKAFRRVKELQAELDKAMKEAAKSADGKEKAALLAAFQRAKADAEELAFEVEDKDAELKETAEEFKELRKKLPVGRCREAFDSITKAKLGPLDLATMLGHKGESYCQDVVELAFKLMAMRLTAEQAVSVTRAFVQLQHPDAVEGDDYRIPSAARFQEWRRYLAPICHYLSLSVIKLAGRLHALHDATTKLGISVFQTAFRCEIKNPVTGKVTIVNVPLKFDIAPSGTAAAEADHMAAAMHTTVGDGQHATLLNVASATSDNAAGARAASALLEVKAKEEVEKVKALIEQHVATHPEEMLDAVDAFMKMSPEQQAHAGEMHQLGCAGHSLNLTTDDCWKISEKPTLEANVVRDLAATLIARVFSRREATRVNKAPKRYPQKLYVRTAAEAAAKSAGFKSGPRLKLTGTGQYEKLPCVSNIITTTSKALATGGEHFLYYLNESRAMQEFAAASNIKVVRLPATKGSRQSINVQLPTAILKNLPTYLAYIDAVRADESEMNKLLVTVWDGLRDRHVVSALRARSFVDVVFTTPMIFFTHHHLVTRPMVRTIMDAAQAFIEEELQFLSEIGMKPAPAQEAIKERVFKGLRLAGFDVTALEAAYKGWWEGNDGNGGMRVALEEGWKEATKKETWAYVSAFLCAAAPPMLATHLRNVDKDCMGISELEYAPVNSDYVESGFAHLDLATRTLCGAGMDACIGVAHASILGAFQTAGARRDAAKAALRRELKSTGASSSGMDLDKAEVDAKVEEFELTSFFSIPKKERWVVIRDLQRRYQKDIVEASRGALKAEGAARLARLRLKKEEHVRLCRDRCRKYEVYCKIVACRSAAQLEALRATFGDDFKACAEALRDQIRVRDHVYKIKKLGVLVGSDNPVAAVARLMTQLLTVVAAALPKMPPPPVPYPTRAAHPAPTSAAVVFESRHLVAVSAALVELAAITAEGAFTAPPRRRRAAASSSSSSTAAVTAPKRPPKRARSPTSAQAALVGEAFEEDGADWKVLAVAMDPDLEEVVVWYYDVAMAADGELTEEEMNLARTGGLDLAPLECSSLKEVKGWIKATRRRR